MADSYSRVNSSRLASNRSNQGYKFELSPLQIVGTSAVVGLLLIIAYVSGFKAGNSHGTLTAIDASERYLAKLPVEIPIGEPSGMEEVASDIYAKLSLDKLSQKETDLDRSTDIAPLLPLANDTSLEEESKTKTKAIQNTVNSKDDSKNKTVELNKSEQAEQKVGSVVDRLQISRNPNSNKNENLKPELSGASKDKLVKSADLKTNSASTESNSEKVLKNNQNTNTKVSNPTPLKGWFVQVSAPALESDATSLAKKLRSSGFDVVIERAKVQQRNYYRVLVGPETNRLTSERMLQQLLREKYLDKSPFIRQIK